MKRTWSTFGLVVVLVSLVFLGGCDKPRQGAGKTYTFKLNYPAGLYVMDMDMDMNQTIKMPGQEIKQVVGMKMGMSMEVGEHTPAENYPVAMKFTRYQMKVEHGGKAVMDFDTADPAKSAQEPLKSIFGGLLAVEIKMEFDAEGDIVTVSGMDAYFESMAKNPALAPQLPALKKELSDKTLAQGIQASKACFPAKPVTVGDTWKVTIDDGKAVMTGTATLEEVVTTPRGELATLKITGVVDKLADQPGVTFQSSNMKCDGTMRLYVATGMMVDYVMKLNGTMKMIAQSQSMDVDMDMDVKMTMTPAKK